MASLYREMQHGREVWRLAFDDKHGARRKLRLGAIKKKTAESHKYHIEQLLERAAAGLAPAEEQIAWLDKIGRELRSKLVALGLAPAPVAAGPLPVLTLGAFLDGYIEGRQNLKPWTITNLKQAKKNLVEHFGANKPLGDITAGDADEYREHLSARLGDNTVRRHCGRAKQFFRHALRKGRVSVNPFGDMKGCTVRANKEREFFITRDMAEKVLEECPNAEWKLLFALSRFGGLRCPAEHLALRLNDIDWARNRMRVASPKTEHHEGKESRWVPIFPELLPYLLTVAEAAPPGSVYVINQYRDAGSNLRTQLERIIVRAGLTAWPKLWHNLRASRATELAAQFPAHVAAEWLGHSAMIAQKHYWQVTDADFEKALAPPANEANKKAPGGGAQGGAHHGRTGENQRISENEKTPVLSGVSQSFALVTNCTVPPVGLEPTT